MDSATMNHGIQTVTASIDQIGIIINAVTAIIGVLAGFFAGFKHGNNTRAKRMTDPANTGTTPPTTPGN